jgi:hypothetical protein
MCHRKGPLPQKRTKISIGEMSYWYQEIEMKSFLLMTGSGPLIILTSHDSIENSILLEKLLAKGIEKFIAYEVPFDLAKQRYGGHFTIVANDLHETDDLRILDYNGDRAFRMFSFSELAEAHIHEPLPLGRAVA